MLDKQKARALAMQVLFLWDAHAAADETMARSAVDGSGEDEAIKAAGLEMARAAWQSREVSDPWVERLAPQWPPRRQPGVDRNILRLAVWELTTGNTPPKVVIDEAIELAKQYSTEQSPAFINGVLDAVLQEHKSLVGTERPKHEGTQV